MRHVAKYVTDPHVRKIDGTTHFGPYTEPEAVTDELIRFFEAVLEPAWSAHKAVVGYPAPRLTPSHLRRSLCSGILRRVWENLTR